jgi:hypothetical protein
MREEKEDDEECQWTMAFSDRWKRKRGLSSTTGGLGGVDPRASERNADCCHLNGALMGPTLIH